MPRAVRFTSVEGLGAELFDEVEKAQGYAYVSDGEHFATTKEFFERQRGRLEYQREAVRRMVKFLRKYGELHGARRDS